MMKLFKIMGLTSLTNLICACAVFNISPEMRDPDYKFKELTSVEFSKEILIKNLGSGNEEKNEDFDSGLYRIDYEKIAAISGLSFSDKSSQYVLVLNIVDAGNFNFTTKDYFRSFPYYLWATLSIASLGIIPTHVHHNVVIKVAVKNISTNRSLNFQEEVNYDSWVSIIFAFKGDFKTAPTVLKDAVEPAVRSILGRVKVSIDQNKI